MTVRGRGAYLNSTCSATKRDGSPCTLPSNGPSGLCWAHNPANAERRRRGQSRGGKNKPSRELLDIKSRISQLADDVLNEEVDKGIGAVVAQILNTYLAAIRTELKVKEVLELEARLAEVEERLEHQKERGFYGA
jgi:hypothetical protein